MVEDSNGNCIDIGTVVVDESGKLLIIDSSDIKGISKRNKEWFSSTRVVTNLNEFIKDNVTVSIGDIKC